MKFHNLKDALNALNTDKKLTEINLSWIQINAEDAKAIAEALKTNKTITSLQLRSSDIGNEGAKVLAEALKTNKTITSIDLEFNNIGTEGAKALAEALKTNKTISSIDLGYNNIEDAIATKLTEAFQTNYTLTSIKLDANYISFNLLDQITALIQRNIKTQDDRKISYEKARNMVHQKEDPQAVLLALKTALTIAEKIKDEASIEEFKQHIPLYEILALFQETGIHGMHQWKTIIEGALQSDPTILYSDPLPVNPSHDTHLQAAIRQHREKEDPAQNHRTIKAKLQIAYKTLSKLKDPRANEALYDLKQDSKIMNNMLRYKYISEILAPLKKLGIFGLARQWEILVDKKLNADTFRLFEANLPDDPSINSIAIAGIRQVRTATQTTKDQGSLTTLYNSYRKLSESVDDYAKKAMIQLERDLDTADTILRLKFPNK